MTIRWPPTRGLARHPSRALGPRLGRRAAARLAALLCAVAPLAGSACGDPADAAAARLPVAERARLDGVPLAEAAPAGPTPRLVRAPGAAAPAIELPAPSHCDLFLPLMRGARLVGELELETAPAGAALRAAVEVVGEDGAVATLVERASDRAGATTRVALDLDLAPWAGSVAHVRLRAAGEGAGTARWHGLAVRAAGTADSAAAQAAPPSRLAPPPASGRLGRPDVVLILLDAARGDAFDGDALTPHVAALAAEGTRFPRAWSPSAWTGQTVPSLLTGRYPDSVGMETWHSRLPPDAPAIPALLAEAGYHTVLWSQHPIYQGNETLRRGFSGYTSAATDGRADYDRVPSAEELFVEGKSTFALVHLVPPHAPYEPPPPFRGSLTSWFEGELDVSEKNLAQLARDLPDPAETDRIVRYARGRYDENVRFADHLVGRIVEHLRAAGRYDGALVAVFADHGEAFLEHGRFGHTTDLYEEFVRVPMIVKWPAATGPYRPAVTEAVSVIDLLPTVLDGAGIEVRTAGFQGKSMLPLARAENPPPAADRRVVFAYTRGTHERSSEPDQKWAARLGRYKLIQRPWPDRGKRPPQELFFDLAADPGEQDDLAAPDRPAALTPEQHYLREFLRDQLLWFREHNAKLLTGLAPAPDAPSLDEATLRNLRALGYAK